MSADKDSIICPFCGCSHTDNEFEYEQLTELNLIECDECGKIFKYEVEIEISYYGSEFTYGEFYLMIYHSFHYTYEVHFNHISKSFDPEVYLEDEGAIVIKKAIEKTLETGGNEELRISFKDLGLKLEDIDGSLENPTRILKSGQDKIHRYFLKHFHKIKEWNNRET